MKFLKSVTVLLLLSIVALGCTNEASQDGNNISEELSYDQELAAELGADEYGMRRYVVALLKSGPNREHDEETAQKLQEGHMSNIRRLATEGKLIVAGPFLGDGELRGIYIFDVSSVEEARELTETDPAIQAGRLEMELHPWYGSAGLKKVNEIHSQISKENP
ncbi:YciI family protein [Aliifodinibius salicampi]|uniref:YciI family protein n=1 Tax=Fodinibius salicampi TaxID=1920655 RepID=A0ABT3Q0A1_9BACT|nr:YciI family protein [Fodinibius salicampi]MCW9713549.1 YciI family protein [Fodinibius salicampi]